MKASPAAPKPSPSIVALGNSLLAKTYGVVDSLELRDQSRLAERYGKPDLATFRMPWDSLQSRTPLTVASPGNGGYLVSPNQLEGYIPGPQPLSALEHLGAQTLTLDPGTVAIPRGVAPVVAQWLADEVTPNALTAPAFGLVRVKRHILLIPISVSRQLTIQSNAEEVVRGILARAIAVEIDRQGIQGDGLLGRPLGLLNIAGTTPIAGAALDYPALVRAMVSISQNDAVLDPDALGFLTTPAIAGQLKTRYSSAANLPIWKGAIAQGSIDEQLACASSSVPAGVLIHGDFSQVVIARWTDGIQFDIDPFSQFQTGIIVYRMMVSIDIQVLNPLGFTVAAAVT